MDLFFLVLLGLICLSLVVSGLLRTEGIYQFPFWAGVICVGWFYPQAVGGYFNRDAYPFGAYADCLLFASLCMVGFWLGFKMVLFKAIRKSWLDAPFDLSRLYLAGVGLCVFGFYFQWKLWSLPEEMLAETQWSGAAVKYLFFASIFKVGFLVLWLVYLSQDKIVAPRLLIFILPCLFLISSAALLRGRRAEMMNLASYILVSLWFVRRFTIPRGLLIVGLAGGLILVNAIGTYRAIMKNKDTSLSERLAQASNADYLASSRRSMGESGSEFKNYIFYRQAVVDSGFYDFGFEHWDRAVFNFVPAQIVGRELKESLMLEYLQEVDLQAYALEAYGHPRKTGSTSTGFYDAYASFGWFGVIKFIIIGNIMGVLYKYAMCGYFLPQLLYVYLLGTAMHAVSHGTHRILVSSWIYFFVLCFPVLFWAQAREQNKACAEMGEFSD
jgi:hypothetical protein